MASFGAKFPYFCPVAEEPEGDLPIYSGDPVKIGRLSRRISPSLWLPASCLPTT